MLHPHQDEEWVRKPWIETSETLSPCEVSPPLSCSSQKYCHHNKKTKHKLIAKSLLIHIFHFFQKRLKYEFLGAGEMAQCTCYTSLKTQVLISALTQRAGCGLKRMRWVLEPHIWQPPHMCTGADTPPPHRCAYTTSIWHTLSHTNTCTQ